MRVVGAWHDNHIVLLYRIIDPALRTSRQPSGLLAIIYRGETPPYPQFPEAWSIHTRRMVAALLLLQVIPARETGGRTPTTTTTLRCEDQR